MPPLRSSVELMSTNAEEILPQKEMAKIDTQLCFLTAGNFSITAIQYLDQPSLALFSISATLYLIGAFPPLKIISLLNERKITPILTGTWLTSIGALNIIASHAVKKPLVLLGGSLAIGSSLFCLARYKLGKRLSALLAPTIINITCLATLINKVDSYYSKSFGWLAPIALTYPILRSLFRDTNAKVQVNIGRVITAIFSTSSLAYLWGWAYENIKTENALTNVVIAIGGATLIIPCSATWTVLTYGSVRYLKKGYAFFKQPKKERPHKEDLTDFFQLQSPKRKNCFDGPKDPRLAPVVSVGLYKFFNYCLKDTALFQEEPTVILYELLLWLLIFLVTTTLFSCRTPSFLFKERKRNTEIIETVPFIGNQSSRMI